MKRLAVLFLLLTPFAASAQSVKSHTNISDGRKVVATAGTAETIASSSDGCNELTIIAETNNTGIIVVGGSTVVAAVATRRGAPLAAGDSITLNIADIESVYIDSTVNGDGVTWVCTEY